MNVPLEYAKSLYCCYNTSSLTYFMNMLKKKRENSAEQIIVSMSNIICNNLRVYERERNVKKSQQWN